MNKLIFRFVYRDNYAICRYKINIQDADKIGFTML
jgi:hypothetical protein